MKNLFYMILSMLVVTLWITSAWSWNEPEDFRGLKFGKDIRVMLPECSSGDFFESSREKKPCWRVIEAETELYTLNNLAPIGDMEINGWGTHVSQLHNKLLKSDG